MPILSCASCFLVLLARLGLPTCTPIEHLSFQNSLRGVMAQFRRGQKVNIPCKVQKGAFPDEVLVTIETDKGIVSGFLKSALILEHKGQQYVQGVVVEASSDSVQVRVPGSFFTTAAGLTTVSSGWARNHLVEVR